MSLQTDNMKNCQNRQINYNKSQNCQIMTINVQADIIKENMCQHRQITIIKCKSWDIND